MSLYYYHIFYTIPHITLTHTQLYKPLNLTILKLLKLSIR